MLAPTARKKKVRELLKKPVLTAPEVKFILDISEGRLYLMIGSGEIPTLPRRSWESRGAAHRIPTPEFRKKFRGKFGL